MNCSKLTCKRALLYSVIPILSIAFLAGPRVSDDTTIKPRLDLPEDLTELRDQIDLDEDSIGNVKKVARKKITFYPTDSLEPKRTKYAVVVVHGFSSSRCDTTPWAEDVAKELGANLFATRVTGHGQEDSGELLDATVNAWVNDSAEAIQVGRKLCTDGVIVLGTSTGATALSWLLCQEEEDYRKGVVAGAFISPNYGVNHPDAYKLLSPWAEFFLKVSGKREKEALRGKTGPRLYSEVWYTSYPTYAAAPSVVLAKIAREARPLRVPIWIGFSKKDSVVIAKETEAFIDRQRESNARIVQMEFDDTEDTLNHIFVGDILAPKTTPVAVDAVVRFLREHRIAGAEQD